MRQRKEWQRERARDKMRKIERVQESGGGSAGEKEWERESGRESEREKESGSESERKSGIERERVGDRENGRGRE